MKVHLNQIPIEGLHIEGHQPAETLDLSSGDILSAEPLRYALDLGLSDGGLFATGTLEMDLEFECVSCLQRFIYPIRIDDFALQTELPGSELVDLTPMVREDIVLALPPHPHCDWDGSRVCKGVKIVASEPLPAPDTWGELDKLKIKQAK